MPYGVAPALPTTAPHSPSDAPPTAVLLKDAPEALVELLDTAQGQCVRKTYRNRGLQWWQTFARRSRAGREFINLDAVRRVGAPCTEPLSWSEQRRMGFVDSSSLVTRYLPDAVTLKQFLAAHDRQVHARLRRRVIAAAGRLVRELHAGGLLWSTPMPRNMLLVGDPQAAQLVVCDVPGAIAYPRSILDHDVATIDVFRAAFSPSRCRDYTSGERLRWLLAYTHGDRAKTRRLWRTLSRRTTMGNDLRRSLSTVRNVYLARTPTPTNAP